MARTKSAIKAIRVSGKKRIRGKAVRTATKTFVAKARESIEGKQVDAAKEAVTTAISQLDRAARKGLLHPNNVARRKSRLVKRLNTLVTAAPAPAATPKATKATRAAKATKGAKATKTTKAKK